MDFDLTVAQRERYDRTLAAARERFGAGRADPGTHLSGADWAGLAAIGLTGLCLPPEHGGGGHDARLGRTAADAAGPHGPARDGGGGMTCPDDDRYTPGETYDELPGACPFSDDTAHPANPTSNDDLRRDLAEQTGGEPWTEFAPGPTPYVEYAAMEVLLSLQHPRTGAAAEPAFIIIISQVKELLFKLLHTELVGVREHIAADQLGEAMWALRRTAHVQRLLLSSWDVLRLARPRRPGPVR